MLKKMLEYVVGLSRPEILDVGGSIYSDKELHGIPKENRVKEPVVMSTLSSLVDYIKSGSSDLKIADTFLVHVVSPTKVRLMTPLDYQGQRDVLVEVNASIPEFLFDHFIDSEMFAINIRSKFMESDDRELVIKFSGTAEKNTLQSYSDDGISQKVTVSQGIASKVDGLVPSAVKLIPFSTFTEVKQPEREFLFRMRDSGGISCALFEADGGAWKHNAVWSIQEYLEEQLQDIAHITILA